MPLATLLLAQTLSNKLKLPMEGWPDWLVVLVGVLAVFVGIWILVKVLKFALWLACLAVLVVGALLVAGMFLR